MDTSVDATSHIRFENENCILMTDDSSPIMKECSIRGADLEISEILVFGVRYERYKGRCATSSKNLFSKFNGAVDWKRFVATAA